MYLRPIKKICQQNETAIFLSITIFPVRILESYWERASLFTFIYWSKDTELRGSHMMTIRMLLPEKWSSMVILLSAITANQRNTRPGQHEHNVVPGRRVEGCFETDENHV